MELVLASANPDKVAEIVDLLTGAGFEVVPRPVHIGDVDETGATLLDNARLKAAAIVAATGRPAVAGGRSLAQLDAAEKHAISHRGRAFRALAAQLTHDSST